MPLFDPSFLAILFGVLSAISWGGGDFCGGLASRRGPLIPVLAVNEVTGLILLTIIALILGEPFLSMGELAWAVAAGLAGTLGIAALYRGLAQGQAAVVAPVSGVLAAGLPVLYGALTLGVPGPLRLAGFALALAGVWLLAGSTGSSGRGGVGLALLAGIGFAGFFLLIKYASVTAVIWPIAVARVAALTLTVPALLATRQSTPRLGAAWRPALLSGVLDAAGNLCYVLALRYGRIDVAAVLSSLYPLSTVALSRVILGERTTPRQGVGAALTLAAIVLIAV